MTRDWTKRVAVAAQCSPCALILDKFLIKEDFEGHRFHSTCHLLYELQLDEWHVISMSIITLGEKPQSDADSHGLDSCSYSTPRTEIKGNFISRTLLSRIPVGMNQGAIVSRTNWFLTEFLPSSSNCHLKEIYKKTPTTPHKQNKRRRDFFKKRHN